MNEQQILQIIGQLEASIDKIEASLNEEEFREYCDATATSIFYWKLMLRRLKKK